MKQTFNTAQSAFTPTKVEYYIRDASGNIMTTYMQSNDLATNTERIYVIDQKIGLNIYHIGITKVRFGLITKSLSYYNCNISVDEQPIYGSARLGTAHYYAVKYAGTIGGIKNDIFAPMNFVLSERLPAYRYIDKKVYELSDHLGNVHVTCSDRLATTYSFIGNTFNLETKQAKELSMQNYYAFGSPHPNTYDATTGAVIDNDGTWSDGDNYRFGFNGQEKDDELKGSGNSLDFGARIYDSRLGRWLSLDPLQAKYPSMSPYNFCANNPAIFVDYDGRYIIFILDVEAANKFGYIAVLIGNEEKGWTYVSMNGTGAGSKPFGKTKNSDLNTKIVDKTTGKLITDPMAAILRANNINPEENDHSYDVSLRMKTSNVEDVLALQAAAASAANGQYAIVGPGKSCIDVAQEAFKTIVEMRTLEQPEDVPGKNDLIPNNWFNKLEKRVDELNAEAPAAKKIELESPRLTPPYVCEVNPSYEAPANKNKYIVIPR